MEKEFLMPCIIRLVAALFVGALVGNERVKHGRAAGMRTHILVCLGACLTSLTSTYITLYTGISGDVFRIPAQVISGIGFLGTGMIILKDNNKITGLTTAAGVWTTGTVGIALGYGFYIGACIVTVLLMISLAVFARFEKESKSTTIIYIEIDDAKKVNSVIDSLHMVIPESFTCSVFAPKTETKGNVGINLIFTKHVKVLKETLLNIDGVVFTVEE